jgi:hypothetical protein
MNDFRQSWIAPESKLPTIDQLVAALAAKHFHHGDGNNDNSDVVVRVSDCLYME